MRQFIEGCWKQNPVTGNIYTPTITFIGVNGKPIKEDGRSFHVSGIIISPTVTYDGSAWRRGMIIPYYPDNISIENISVEAEISWHREAEHLPTMTRNNAVPFFPIESIESDDNSDDSDNFDPPPPYVEVQEPFVQPKKQRQIITIGKVEATGIEIDEWGPDSLNQIKNLKHVGNVTASGFSGHIPAGSHIVVEGVKAVGIKITKKQ